MAWEVREMHARRYPDEGWTMEKCVQEDEAWRAADPQGHPAADGWPIWDFRYSRPDEGPGPGVLPEGPIIDFHCHCWVDSFAPRMRAYFEDSFGITVFDPGTLDGLTPQAAWRHLFGGPARADQRTPGPPVQRMAQGPPTRRGRRPLHGRISLDG